MAVNVDMDTVLDEIVDQILDGLVPESGDPVTADRPLYVAQRYMGSDLSTEEILKRVVAGRTPAALVRHVGDRSIRTVVGRRVDRVESEIAVIVCSDRQDGRDERKALIAIAESVRGAVGARMYDQPMSPLRWTKTETLRDTSELLALSLSFTTKHRVDYTIDPGLDTIETVAGSIFAGEILLLPTLATAGTAGSTVYGYRVDYLDADGARYEGQAARITTGPATLTGTNYIAITWEEFDGAASYEVVRVESEGIPSTVGTIGATSLLTFDDTGLATTSALLPEPYTQSVELDFT